MFWANEEVSRHNVGQEAKNIMLCVDFESLLTDYIEGVIGPETNKLMGEHAMRCPICHETLSAVRSSMEACRNATVPPPSRELEARILQKTVPETAMTCEEFEESLTDYLDGFLPAQMYHRWERHAALCDRCTELPGEVVRAIGACYTYISEEKPVPAGLNERILQATLGTVTAQEIKAPWRARAASRFRVWLDPIISPQLATVATMLLAAVLVLSSTVSADGSITGVYNAGLALAERTSGQTQVLSSEIVKPVSSEQSSPAPAPQKQATDQQQEHSGAKPDSNGHNKR
jgi:anti-sigma factor RsiW